MSDLSFSLTDEDGDILTVSTDPCSDHPVEISMFSNDSTSQVYVFLKHSDLKALIGFLQIIEDRSELEKAKVQA